VVATSWHVLWNVHSVYDKEEHLASLGSITKSQNWCHDDLLLVSTTLDLLSDDLDLRISFVFADWLDENLVLGGNDLMESELKFTYEIMFVPGFEVLKVINIVNNNFKKLLLFKFVRYVEALDPFWVETVHNDLCLAQHLPHIASLFIQDCHTISPCKRVQIGQFLASKCKSQNLA
jgi:hypothetical protein